MKYLKTYEEVNIGQPEVDDYVLVDSDDIHYQKYSNKYIGKITDIEINTANNKRDIFYVLFNNSAPYVKSNVTRTREIFFRYEIKYWSKNKEELEPILQANKYNL